MRIGLVSYLNAQPLGYGFLQSGIHEIVQDLPSRLFEQLRSGKLDAALISSVECLRSPDLGWSRAAGVCAAGAVRSILYFERKGQKPGTHLPARVLADSGSRTSQALLRVLFQKALGSQPVLVQMRASEIADQVRDGEGGLLIGDAALDFYERKNAGEFLLRDLGEWWMSQESLPMVYALWAYPAERPVADSFFTESLDAGIHNLEVIARNSGRAGAEDYLKRILHYYLTDKDREALNVFSERLGAAGLL